MKLLAALFAALVAVALSVGEHRDTSKVLDALIGSVEGLRAEATRDSPTCTNPKLEPVLDDLNTQIQASKTEQEHLQDELKALKAEMDKKKQTLLAAQERLAENRKKAGEADGKREAAKAKLAKLVKSQKSMETRLKDQAALLAKMSEDIAQAKALKQDGVEKGASLKEQVKLRKDQLAKVKEEARIAADEAKELASQKQDLVESVQLLEARVVEATGETRRALTAARSARSTISTVALAASDPVAESEYNSAQDALNDLILKRSKLETKMSGVKAQQAQQEGRHKDLTEQRDKLQHDIESTNNANNAADKEVAAMTAALAAAKSALGRLERFEAAAKGASASLKKRYDGLTAKKRDLAEKQIPLLEASLAKHKKAIEASLARKDKAVKETADSTAAIAKLEVELTSLNEQADELSVQAKKLSVALKKLQEELTIIRKESKGVYGELATNKEAEGRLAAAVARVDRLVSKATGKVRKIKDAREDLLAKKRALIGRGECGNDGLDCDAALEALDDEHKLVIDGIANDNKGEELMAAAEAAAAAEEKAKKAKEEKKKGRLGQFGLSDSLK